jgi:exodeoxyribonuclease VII small subunit
MKNEMKITFEEAMQKLTGYADKLDSRDVSLEESIAAYEDGLKYYNICNEILNNAEQKIETIERSVKGGEGA